MYNLLANPFPISAIATASTTATSLETTTPSTSRSLITPGLDWVSTQVENRVLAAVIVEATKGCLQFFLPVPSLENRTEQVWTCRDRFVEHWLVYVSHRLVFKGAGGRAQLSQARLSSKELKHHILQTHRTFLCPLELEGGFNFCLLRGASLVFSWQFPRRIVGHDYLDYISHFDIFPTLSEI